MRRIADIEGGMKEPLERRLLSVSMNHASTDGLLFLRSGVRGGDHSLGALVRHVQQQISVAGGAGVQPGRAAAAQRHQCYRILQHRGAYASQTCTLVSTSTHAALSDFQRAVASQKLHKCGC